MKITRSIMNQRYTTTTLLLLAVCAAGAQTAAPDAQEIRVTLLGTVPMPNLGRAGISTLVEAGPERFLIDAGSGVMERLVQAGFLMDPPSKLFITHLHSDHIVDISHLLLMPWTGPSQRKAPLEVWGPRGTREMMRHLEAAFAFDIHVRRDIDERISPEGINTTMAATGQDCRSTGEAFRDLWLVHRRLREPRPCRGQCPAGRMYEAGRYSVRPNRVQLLVSA
jgi:cytochrome c556